MPLLSVSDSLLFFTLVLNACAVARPGGGISSHFTSRGSSVFTNDGGLEFDADSESFLDKNTSVPAGEGGLNDRAQELLVGLRRGGLFIALWNCSVILVMLFVLS